MRSKPLNAKETQESFNNLLQEAIDLGLSSTRSDSGLDLETTLAIDLVAESYPSVDSKLIQNARKEFAKQLDGEHIREGKAKWANWYATRYDS